MHVLSLAVFVAVAMLASAVSAHEGRRDYPADGIAHGGAMRRANKARSDGAYGQTLNLRRVDAPFYAGDNARQACENLAKATLSDTGLTLNGTFSQYYEAGSNPSLELLTATYPSGWIPHGVNVSAILSDVGPDIDIPADLGYGFANGRTASNGPLGGLPPFCRFGAYIVTSPITQVLSEVWLPFADDESLPLAAVNATDFPTDSTPLSIAPDGTVLRGPPGSVGQGGKVVSELSNKRSDSFDPEDPASAPAAVTSFGAEAVTGAIVGAVTGVVDGVLDGVNQGSVEERNYSGVAGEDLLGDGVGWNGRIFQIGNGGQRGFVPLTDLKQYMRRYMGVVAGTNGGHFSTTGGVAPWVNATVNGQRVFENTILDAASRSNHVTLVLAQAAAKLVYGEDAGVRVKDQTTGKIRLRAYLAACSVGGGRSLSSVQVYPNDFDGVFAGSPAIGFNQMNIGQIHLQSTHRKAIAKGGYIDAEVMAGAVHEAILSRCDEALDGVADGVMVQAENCQPKFEEDLLCGAPTKWGASSDTCLNSTQIANLEELYKPTILDGIFIYPRFLPGLEQLLKSYTGAAAKAIAWTQLVVLKQPKLDPDFNGYPGGNITGSMVDPATDEDVGGFNADDPQIADFINAGRKLIMTHGLGDLVISPQATQAYYKQVIEQTTPYLKGPYTQVSDGFKYYEIPGMSHCRDGPGPWHFGSPTQNDEYAGNRPLQFDSKHDIFLALIAWSELNLVPSYQVAATYATRNTYYHDAPPTNGTATDIRKLPTPFANKAWGLENTRRLCPYPKRSQYIGGDTTGEDAYKSFICA